MVFEEWAAFNSGLLLSVIFALIIIVYFKLRERVSKVERILKSYLKKTEESAETEETESEPKEI